MEADVSAIRKKSIITDCPKPPEDKPQTGLASLLIPSTGPRVFVRDLGSLLEGFNGPRGVGCRNRGLGFRSLDPGCDSAEARRGQAEES